MEVYLSGFFVLLGLCALDVYSGRRGVRIACLAVGTVLVILLIGLRWETGNDWTPYLQYYEELRGFSELGTQFEPGYRLLVLLATKLGLSYSAFLLLSATIYMTAFAAIFARFRHPNVLLLLFFCTYMLGFMGTQRQTLALGFACLGILRFYDRKVWAGLLLVALATSLHYTAIVSVLALFVPRTRTSFAAFAVLLLGGLLLYELDVVGAVVERTLNAFGAQGYLLRRLVAYATTGDWQPPPEINSLAGVLWFVKRVALAAIFWVLCSRERRSLDNYLVNLYVLSAVLFFAFAKAVPIVALRGPLYFAFFEVVLMYLALSRIGGRFRRESLLFIGAPLAAARLYAGIFLYAPALYLPYKSLLLNADFARLMY